MKFDVQVVLDTTITIEVPDGLDHESREGKELIKERVKEGVIRFLGVGAYEMSVEEQ